jgi:hypothetical protein
MTGIPGPPVSVTARAVSSTGTMPVHVELVEAVLFFVMCSPWSGESVVYDFFKALTRGSQAVREGRPGRR